MSVHPKAIGTASMKSDGTIVLRLRACSDEGSVGDAVLEYGPEDPEYETILEHVGPLAPGHEIDVAPWPDSK